MVVSFVLPCFGRLKDVEILLWKLSRKHRQILITPHDKLKQLVPGNIQKGYLSAKHVTEQIIVNRLCVCFTERATSIIRHASTLKACCSSLFDSFYQYRGAPQCKVLVFIADVSKFSLNSKDVISQHVVYYQFNVDDFVIVGLLHDNTTKKKVFKKLLQALEH